MQKLAAKKFLFFLPLSENESVVHKEIFTGEKNIIDSMSRSGRLLSAAQTVEVTQFYSFSFIICTMNMHILMTKKFQDFNYRNDDYTVE